MTRVRSAILATVSKYTLGARRLGEVGEMEFSVEMSATSVPQGGSWQDREEIKKRERLNCLPRPLGQW